MIGIVCAFFHTEGKGFYSNHQLRLCSRGSADPRESLRKCWISYLLKAPAKGCLTLGAGALFLGIGKRQVCIVISKTMY